MSGVSHHRVAWPSARLAGERRWILAAALSGTILLTVLHLLAPHEHPAQTHHLLRRLYYVPILAAAWAWGWRGGFSLAAVTVLSYAPHAFGFIGLHADPASPVDKVAEMVLFLIIGVGVGFLVDRERLTSSALRSSLSALSAAQEQLLHAEEHAALGQLTAGFAHEVRNPLGAIRGSAEILRDGHPEGDRLRRIAELLVQQTERLDNVVARFLRLAQGAPVDLRPVELGSVARQAVELATAEACARGVHLDVEDGEHWALGDEGLLRHVVLNLVLNAVQVQKAGGRVIVAVRREEAGPVLFVDDAGPGIAPEDRGAVFRPFWTRREGGTGLGLSITRRIVLDHGGDLRIGESPLGGARFDVQLRGTERT